MKNKSKKKLKRILVWYLGPAISVLALLLLIGAVSAASIAGYMAYQLTRTINAEHQLISNSLTGNCKASLEQQGYVVEKPKPPEPEPDLESDPDPE